MISPRTRIAAGVAAVLAALAATVWFPTTAGGQPDHPVGLDRAIRVQEAHTAQLMARSGVIGTAVGVEDETPTVMVLTERVVGGLPSMLDGVPVEVVVTGPISAAHHRSGHDKGGGGDTTTTTTTLDEDPPPSGPTMAIGDSTSRGDQCAAGTVGGFVADSARTYLLSNNHVLANENAGDTGDVVVTPGLLDTKPSCSSSQVAAVADLSDWVPIDFGGGPNTVDAAIAGLHADVTGANAAPSYGALSDPVSEALDIINMAVQKHGRTTGHTTGVITAVNGTVNVGYTNGTALFVDQIIVEGKAFLRGGDSGSLLVTMANEPVGLLFAGNRSGSLAVANRIQDVLDALSVSFPPS